MTEIADGIYRIESDLGPRFMCQYVVAGRDRSVLVDTGLADTPAAVIDPYLSRAGLEPDFVLISHADNDHVGGNRAFRDAHPEAVFACHELDRRWVESNEALVRENYSWHAAYGFPSMDGIYDRAGNKLIPPRYYDLEALRRTIARLEALEPELLLTAHYPVLERADALEWLATGRVFVDDVERVVREAPAEDQDDLWALTQRVEAALGPFPQFVTELGATVREATH